MPDYTNDPELLLDNIANLDTARMTLRWALERIRGLEKSNSETHELLRQAHADRQKSVDELESFKLSIEDRSKRVAEKERFVSEMQTILNDLFKGEVDVAEFIRRRTDIESAKADLEKKVRKRLQESEDAHRRELEENNKRLAEMEGVYSAALTDAQRKYRAELETLQKDHDLILTEERKKLDEVRERSHRDSVKQADDYQRKILSLEHNYHAKRAELDKDIDRLREKLLEEQNRHINRAQEEVKALRGSWDAERGRLESLLNEREEQIAAQEQSLTQLERDYHERHRDQGRRFEEDLASLQSEHIKQTEAHARALAEAGDKIRVQQEAFQQERQTLLEKQNRLREDVAQEYEQTFQALQHSLIEKERSRATETAKRVEQLQQSHDATVTALQARIDSVRKKAVEREDQLNLLHESDLEAIRKHYEAEDERRKLEFLSRAQTHAEETRTLRIKLREESEQQLQEQARQTAAHRERIRVLEAALEDSHHQSLRDAEQRHTQTLAEQAKLLHRQRQDSIEEERGIRKEDNLQMRETLRRQVEAAQLREQAHAQEQERLRAEFDKERSRLESSLKAAEVRREGELRDSRAQHDAALREERAGLEAELKALHEKHNEELGKLHAALETDRQRREGKFEEARQKMREEMLAKEHEHREAVAALESRIRALQGRFEEGLGKLRERQTALREEELLKREQAVQELESFFKSAQKKTWADTTEQLEALRHHYKKSLEAMGAPKEAKQRPAPIQTHRAYPPGAAAAMPAAVSAKAAPEHAPPQRRNGRWLKFGILALAAAAGLWGLQQWRGGAGRDYAVPFSHPAALVWEGDALWAADWKEQTVFRMRLSGDRLVEDARFSIPETHIGGMALAEGFLYVSDSWQHVIQRWRVERGRLILEKSWPSPGPNPAALYFDGMHLWSADLTERRLYRHLVDDALTTLDSYPIDHAAVGLFADKDRFWSADSDNRIVFRHRWDRRLTPIRALSLPELQTGKTPLSAFTMRGDRIWIGRDGSETLIERPLWRFTENALNTH